MVSGTLELLIREDSLLLGVIPFENSCDQDAGQKDDNTEERDHIVYEPLVQPMLIRIRLCILIILTIAAPRIIIVLHRQVVEHNESTTQTE